MLFTSNRHEVRFDSDILLDVQVQSNRRDIWILLADGTLLTWNPMDQKIPIEVCKLEADAILGDDWLVCDDDLIQISRLSLE